MRHNSETTIFGLSRLNSLAPGHTESLTGEQLTAAQKQDRALQVSVRPGRYEDHTSPGKEFEGVSFVSTIPEGDLGIQGLRGVLTIESADPENAAGLTMRAHLLIDGIVPPLELDGTVLRQPAPIGGYVFVARPTEPPAAPPMRG